MRGLSAVLVAAVGLILFAAGAEAGIPCAAYCSCAILVENNLPCGDADLRWCPGCDLDHIFIYVTVRDCLQNPIDTCSVRLDLSGGADPQEHVKPASISICGDPTRWDTTNANGAAMYDIWGGGCGRFYLGWTVTAECATPPVQICEETDTLCVKSPDINGDLRVSFFDTFKYLPCLATGAGYCCDFNCDGNVNFFDTFQYLPHLSAGCQCTPGFALPNDPTLTDCP